MSRDMLTDEQWAKIKPVLPSERGHHGRPYIQSHRTTVEGILWILRTGAPWRDLPERYGKWITVYQRFRRWAQNETFRKALMSLDGEFDLTTASVDGTFARVHQHAAGAPKEDALPTSPAPAKALGPAEEGQPPRSSHSPTAQASSHDSHSDPETPTRAANSPVS